MAGPATSKPIAAVYLARGADPDSFAAFTRFVESYRRCPAQVDHDLIVVLKGFASACERERCVQIFAPFQVSFIEVDDESFDIGAYIDAACQLEHASLCFLNTHSEILASGWLARLSYHLRRPEVGALAATGSFESLDFSGFIGPAFPNAHLRSNCFAVRRTLFLDATAELIIRTKLDAYKVESGFLSLTRQIMGRGFETSIVGKNGRAYSPRWWPCSGTFRQGHQENLLVGDNHTRSYEKADLQEKLRLMQLAWGDYLEFADFSNEPNIEHVEGNMRC